MNSTSKEIIKLLKKVTATGHSQSQIFDDWLEITHLSLEALPKIAQAYSKGETYTDPPEVAEVFKRVQFRYGTSFELLKQAFAILIQSCSRSQVFFGNENGIPGDTSPDTLGEVYMEFGLPSKYTGQFFTPWPIAQFMALASMKDVENEVHERIKEACNKDVFAQALLAASMVIRDGKEAGQFFFGTLLPYIARRTKEQVEPDQKLRSHYMRLIWAIRS
ncbi:hypothetical protein ADN00_15590 [Ornatilinea apprima]|uniref:Uncharacterized protein n=1 Tax=Ornatilinea apprima TaxID=1134406 RepID=A0A0P6XKU5_9CHLR|nr:hypothetical protein [Ornatilinea apprima]KPL72239.1 hypothetical protein ADN00_15590 [Ornatilinea apprima]